jgi:CRP-like cAMP-binding protein
MKAVIMRNRQKGIIQNEVHLETKPPFKNTPEENSSTAQRPYYRSSTKRNFFSSSNNRFDILHSAKNNADSPFKALGFAVEGETQYQHHHDTSGIDTAYPNLILTPESPIRWKWDILMSITLMWVSIFTPLQISYFSDSMTWRNVEEWPVLFTLDRLVDLIFIFDMFVTLRTAWRSEEDGRLRFTQGEATLKYLGTYRTGPGWFWIDLLSVIPFEILTGANSGVTRVPRVIRIVRLLKLSKVLKMVKIFVRVERHLGTMYRYGLLRIYKFVFLIIFLTHLLSCALYMTALLGDESTESWLDRQTDSKGLPLRYASTQEIYVTGIYWAMTTLTTTGYGDVIAANFGEKIFFTLVMLLSTFLFAYVVGNFCIIIDGLQARSFTFQNYMDQLNDFMDLEAVPVTLRDLARNQTYYRFEHPKVYNNKDYVLDKLSDTMKEKIMHSSYGVILRNISYFKDISNDVLSAICTRLNPQPFCPHEIIYRQRAHGDGMYLLLSGDARAYYEAEDSDLDVKVYTKLRDGDVFGYRSLLFEGDRIMTVETISYCQTFCLKSTLFKEVLTMYPYYAVKIKKAIIKTLWKSLLKSSNFINLSHDEDFLHDYHEVGKVKLFDKWYMITRDTKLSRMLALLEGQNKEKKKTNVEEATAEEDDIRSITKKSSKLYYGQLHTLLKHGSLDDAMLSTLFFLLQQQQKSMKVLQSVTERSAIS